MYELHFFVLQKVIPRNLVILRDLLKIRIVKVNPSAQKEVLFVLTLSTFLVLDNGKFNCGFYFRHVINKF